MLSACGYNITTYGARDRVSNPGYVRVVHGGRISCRGGGGNSMARVASLSLCSKFVVDRCG